jgi:MFS family permease
VSSMAYPLLVLMLTHSAADAGWASFAALGPSALAYLPAGALIDRWDPRKAMLRSELSRGAVITTIVALLCTHLIGVEGLVALAAVEQVLAVFSGLAERRFASSLVEPRQVVPALARSEARTHVVILVGRPLGGLLFGLWRLLPFLADAVTFLVTVAALTLIGKRQAGGGRERAASPHLRHEIANVFRWLRMHRFAEIALLLTGGATLISQALIMVFLAGAHTGKLLPAIGIGVVLAASGAGGALGSAIASLLFRHFEYHLLQIQMFTWAVMFAILFLWGRLSFWVMAAVMAVMGLTGALGNIEVDTFVVRKARTMLARVISVGRLTSLCALALGPLLGASLFARFGLGHAILVLLLMTLALGVVALGALPAALRKENGGGGQPASPTDGGGEDGQGTRADGDAISDMASHA